MFGFLFLLTSVVIFLPPGHGTIQIISSHPQTSTIVPEGSNITLSCSSSVPWFFCLWNSPRNEKQCAIQEDEVRGVCSRASSSLPLSSPPVETDDDSDGHLSVYKLSGARRTCSLFVDAVTREMHGQWMCLLNEISQFNSVKHTVQLQVGVEAKLSWKLIQGYEGTGETELESDSPSLHLTEGDEVKIVCVATEGFPLMQFDWEHQGVVQADQAGQANLTKQRTGREYKEPAPWDRFQSQALNNTRKAVYSLGGGSHLYSGSQTVDYKADLTHNNSVLVCKIKQVPEEAENQKALYSGSVHLRLRISPQVIIGSNTHIHESIGVISGIILAIIFIILIFILVSIFLTRRRKTNKKYSTLTDKSSEELLKPIWVAGKSSKSRICVGSVKEYSSEFQQFGGGRELSDSGPSVKRSRGRELVHSCDKDQPEHLASCHPERIVFLKSSVSPSVSQSVRSEQPEYHSQHPLHHHQSCPHGEGGRGYRLDTSLDIPETGLDISVETHSEHSSTEHSRNISAGASVSRPTTRTTKTISDGTDSSRSSVLLEGGRAVVTRGDTSDNTNDNIESFLRGDNDNMESYISFQSDIRDHSDTLYSPNSTMNSDKISCIATDTEYHQVSRATEPGQREDSSSVSLLHETHFGDSLTDIPRTVISAFKHIPPTDLERISKRYSMVKLGNTIFDCQEGCFISFEEFEKRISQESLDKYKN